MEHSVSGSRLYIWVCADFDDLSREILRFCVMHDPYMRHEIDA